MNATASHVDETGRYRLPVTIRTVSVDRSGDWLSQGWRDMWRAPTVSFAYGGAFVIISYALTFGLIDLGYGALVLPLAGGFMLMSPILVVGLYEVSRRLETGDSVGLGCVFCLRNAGQVAAMGVVLMLFHFFWVVIAIFLFAVFFGANPPPLEMDAFLGDVLFTLNGAPFLLLGTALGGLLAIGIFTISAVSVPMLLDRDVDVVTAIAASIMTVRANWQVMVGWAAMIGVILAVGLATFYIGLALALPTLGYATWHAYRDLIAPEDDSA